MTTIKDWGKGLNRDQPPWELAPGFWSDCQNMRFRNGKAQRIGGVTSVITPTVTPYWMLAYSAGATKYVFYAGLAKTYLHDGTTETEVTRLDSSGSVTVTALSRSGTTVTLTTGAVHGLTTGDSVTVSGANRYPGFNGTYLITVGSTTTFTYTSALAGNKTFSSADLESVTYVSTAVSGADFTGGVDDKITGGNLNGALIYNNPIDGMFYLDQAVTLKMVPMVAFSAYKADAARPFLNYIFALAPTFGGVKYRHQVMWSSAAEPGTIPLYFAASSTNDAGAVDLVSGGEMVDCLEWGESIVIYKRDARFVGTHIGGAFVFDFQRISSNHKDDGLLAANCVVNTPVGQVFLTDGKDVRIHQGGESISLANGVVHEWLRNNINVTYESRSFLTVNPLKNEVWVCFPTTGNSLCNKALIWNWDAPPGEGWGEADLTNVTAATAGEFPAAIATSPRMLLANSTPRIGLVDSGTTYFTAAYTSMLERTGMFGDDGMWKTLHASLPLFDASSNFTASIYHGSSPTQDGTVTYASAQTYTHNTTRRVTAFANSGPYVAWKMTTTAADVPSLRSIRFDINIDGTD